MARLSSLSSKRRKHQRDIQIMQLCWFSLGHRCLLLNLDESDGTTEIATFRSLFIVNRKVFLFMTFKTLFNRMMDEFFVAKIESLHSGDYVDSIEACNLLFMEWILPFWEGPSPYEKCSVWRKICFSLENLHPKSTNCSILYSALLSVLLINVLFSPPNILNKINFPLEEGFFRRMLIPLNSTVLTSTHPKQSALCNFSTLFQNLIKVSHRLSCVSCNAAAKSPWSRHESN